MPDRLQRVRLETERHTIEGSLQLPAEGFRSRLTDFLNAQGVSFIPLTGARVVPLDGRGAAREFEYLAVSSRHVVLASEIDAPEFG